jgi:carboxymethylenebutenolidase
VTVRLETGWLPFDTPAGTTDGYIAWQSGSQVAQSGVLVLQELWGVDEHIMDVADRFATAGYVAFAPDLNSSGGGRPPTLSSDRIAAAIAYLDASSTDYGAFVNLLVSPSSRMISLRALPKEEAASIDETLIDLLEHASNPRHPKVVNAAYEALRNHPSCHGSPVAAVGYCQGGALAARLACDQPDLAAAVVYYGGSPSVDLVRAIRCPIRGFYGGEDIAILAQLPAFEAALEAGAIDHELRVYPGVLHAFSNETRPWYNREAARDAWARTLAFLADRLAPVASRVVAEPPR